MSEVQNAKIMVRSYGDKDWREPSHDERGAALAIAMGEFVNYGIGSQEKYFVDEIHRQHRTLQGGIFRLFWALVKGTAKRYKDAPTVWFDARNESTGTFSARLVELEEQGDLRVYLPYI